MLFYDDTITMSEIVQLLYFKMQVFAAVVGNFGRNIVILPVGTYFFLTMVNTLLKFLSD